MIWGNHSFKGCSRPAQTTTSDTDEEGIYTPGTYIGDAVISILPEKILENQQQGVDVVAGASYSSLAILEAVEKAMMLAGAGIAGLSAALEVINQGANVILVEKMPFIGGSSIRSGGKILAADNIEWLIENGVELAQDVEPLHSFRTPPRGHYTANGSRAGVITPLEGKQVQLQPRRNKHSLMCGYCKRIFKRFSFLYKV